MVIRTYIEKNNTIIKDSEVNTGRNPIAEIYYGGFDTRSDFTRHLLYFGVEDLQDRYSKGQLGDLSKVTHTLKLCNSSYFDQNLQAQKLLDGKQRTSSFDLILFKVNQDWDEGTGYDYGRQILTVESDNNITFVQGSSNWFYAQTNSEWTFDGVYTGTASSAITIATQHFDKGNENVEMDITDEVNKLITGGTDNFGGKLLYGDDKDMNRFLHQVIQENGTTIPWINPETNQTICHMTYYEDNPYAFTNSSTGEGYQDENQKQMVINMKIDDYYKDKTFFTFINDYINSQIPLYDQAKVIPTAMDFIFGTITKEITLPPDCIENSVKINQMFKNIYDSDDEELKIIAQEELVEFTNDGLEIIDFFIRHRQEHFHKHG